MAPGATMQLMPEVPADRARELRDLHRRIPVARHTSLALHWLAGWWRPPRPARHEPIPRVERGQVAITFGGHATALVRYAGLDIAFDPMLGRWLGGVRRAQEPEPSALVEERPAGQKPAKSSCRRLPTTARTCSGTRVVFCSFSGSGVG
jgi:hypothetical protein